MGAGEVEMAGEIQIYDPVWPYFLLVVLAVYWRFRIIPSGMTIPYMTKNIMVQKA